MELLEDVWVAARGNLGYGFGKADTPTDWHPRFQESGFWVLDVREDATDQRSIRDTEEEFPQFTQPNHYVAVVSVTVWWIRPSAVEFE